MVIWLTSRVNPPARRHSATPLCVLVRSHTMDLDISKTHILITGAAGGIGIATVREFLAHGCRVTAHYRSTRASLDHAFPDEIRGGRVRCLKADVVCEGDVETLFGEAERGMGVPPAVLVGAFFFAAWVDGWMLIPRSEPCRVRIHAGAVTYHGARAVE